MEDQEIIDLNISQEEQKDLCEEERSASELSTTLRNGKIKKKASGASIRQSKRLSRTDGEPVNNKRFNMSPESISDEQKGIKRARSDKKVKFSEVVKGIEVIIKPTDYPETLMDPKGVQALEAHILRKIDMLKVGEVAPQFHQRKLIDGYWRIRCIGEQSREWLEKTVNLVRYRTKKLHMIDASELIEKPKCRVFVPGECSMDLVIMHRFKVQNKGFDFSSWRIISNKRSSNNDGRSIIIELSEQSIEELRKFNFYLSHGLTQVKFHLLEKESGGDSNAKTDQNNKEESMELEEISEIE